MATDKEISEHMDTNEQSEPPVDKVEKQGFDNGSQNLREFSNGSTKNGSHNVDIKSESQKLTSSEISQAEGELSDDSNASPKERAVTDVAANHEPSAGPAGDDEDLEDGEIDDDEEEAEVVPVEETKDKRKESKRSRKSESHSDSDEGRRSSRHKKHKSDRRKRDLEKEIKSDEERKRILKEKLRALELQMGEEDYEDVDDEEMGIYAAGGSPPRHPRSRVHDGEDSDEGSNGSESLSSQRNPRRRASDLEGSSKRKLEKSSEVCPLFMLGKCPKTAHSCAYSHNADPPKIMELCKFYLFERCAKKEKCLYLHKGFPCKYYHTGKRCLDTAETCKFSHEPLTDITRNILIKHLESAPKEILGDFPRMSREMAASVVFQTEAKHKGWIDEFEDMQQDHLRKQTRSAADSFIEMSSKQQNESAYYGGPDDIDRKRSRHSRWGGEQQGVPPYMPDMGPRGPHGLLGPGPGGPMPPGGLAGPMIRGGGPGGHRGPKGLLGSGPQSLNSSAPRPLMSLPVAPPLLLSNANQAFPPGYVEGGINEEQVKSFLRARREASRIEAKRQARNSSDTEMRSQEKEVEDVTSSTKFNMFGPDSGSVMFGQSSTESSDEPPTKVLKKNENGPDGSEPDSVAATDSHSPTQPARLFEKVDDNWYSSDDDSQKSRKRKKRWDVVGDDESAAATQLVGPPTVSTAPTITLPKELADVLATIKPKEPIVVEPPESKSESPPVSEDKPPTRDPRMNRDPRFARVQQVNDHGQNSKQTQDPPISTPSAEDSEKEKEKRMLEVDLSIFGELEIPTFKDSEPVTEDEDNMGLPFKPHRVQPVAKEIEASVHSHAPIDYKLTVIDSSKPDYSSLVVSIPVARIQQDPRLRRYSKKRPLPLEPAVAAVEAKSSPTPVERPSDPRRNRGPALSEQPGPDPNSRVYNPKNDFYPRPGRDDEYQKPPDVYSPSQDVHAFGPPPRQGLPPREEGFARNRQFQDHYWNERGFEHPRHGDWGPQGGPRGSPRDGGDFYDDDRSRNFYNNGGRPDPGGQPYPEPRGPPQNVDPRLNRRDPRRRD